MEILSLIAKFLLAPLVFILALAGYTVPQTNEYLTVVQNAQMDEPALGTTIANTVAGFETSLASSITDSDTQMTLVSFSTDDGTDLTVGKQYAFTIDEGSASREFVIGTASTSNRIVSLVRGISVVDGATEVEANKKDHRRGASVKITNFQLVTITNILNDTATIPSPLRYASDVATSSLSNAQHLASRAYVDSVAFSGASVISATESARGVVELATQLEMASSTPTGSSGPLALQSKYATSTGGYTGHWAVITNSLGKISENFFASIFTNPYTFSGTTTFSGQALELGQFNINAGETINGAITPVPVYASTTGTVFAMDGNVTTTQKFVGFAVTNATVGTKIVVQSRGVVDGFTGLITGSTYHIQDAVGTIGTTTGTYTMQVGMAIASTSLLIQKGQRYVAGTFSTVDVGGAGATQDTVVTSGFRPSKVTVHGLGQTPALSDDYTYTSSLFYVNGTNYTVGAWNDYTPSIINVTDSGFTVRITQTPTGPDTMSWVYSAEGEL